MRILVGTIAGAIIASLLSAWAVGALLTERIAIIGSFLGLQRSYNEGVAFGIFLGSYQDIIILVAIGVLTYAAWRSAHTVLEQIGFGLILGGGIANVIDRVPDGLVTDMIQIGSFPIFNVADASINIGVFLLVLSFFQQRKNSRCQIPGSN